eukprot:TRINITY_DN5237_c0_g1_i1.p2 TRINITY_DN5237_c0_g1~~TRINITY_DN5237_c0_g1_i1.p2  ORF type:complete len:324 (+),score=137.34 TRINITY_DN5237_c0_g1_i1:1494-2465(+)
MIEEQPEEQQVGASNNNNTNSSSSSSSNSSSSPITIKRSQKRSVFPKKEAKSELGSEVSGSTLSHHMKKNFKNRLEASKKVKVELSQGKQIEVDATLSEDLKKQKMDEYKFKLQERKRIRAMKEEFEEDMPDLVDSWDSSTDKNFFIQLERVPFLLTEKDVEAVWKHYVIEMGKSGDSNQKMDLETLKSVMYDMLFWCYSNIGWFQEMKNEFFESMSESHSLEEVQMLFHVNIFHGAIQKADVGSLAQEMMAQMGSLSPQDPIVTRIDFEANFAKAAEKVLGDIIGFIPGKVMKSSQSIKKAQKEIEKGSALDKEDEGMANQI